MTLPQIYCEHYCTLFTFTFTECTDWPYQGENPGSIDPLGPEPYKRGKLTEVPHSTIMARANSREDPRLNTLFGRVMRPEQSQPERKRSHSPGPSGGLSWDRHGDTPPLSRRRVVSATTVSVEPDSQNDDGPREPTYTPSTPRHHRSTQREERSLTPACHRASRIPVIARLGSPPEKKPCVSVGTQTPPLGFTMELQPCALHGLPSSVCEPAELKIQLRPLGPQ